uniref:Methyltransferase type 11 domain-containing protein n=1 Tax=Leersia perrieri TaxID=77586 RepID=A0A0D9XXQ8_9ORYZ
MATGLAAGGRRLLLPLHLRAAHLLPPQSHLSSSASAAEGMDGGDRGGGRVKIFDRELKRRQRDRAAWAMGKTDALADAVADNLLDRLEDCRKAFPSALCLGGSAGAIRRLLRGRGGIEKLIMMDMSADMVRKWQEMENATDDSLETHFVVGDEEYLPIKESSQDMIISCLGLHWTNDLPGAMIQCRLALKPDGLFLAAILGGETLKELRIACTIAQMEREGGISPRMSPLAQILKKDTALATAAIYQSMFGLEDGTIPATFQVIYMTGWKEHPSQQKAKRRGSATVSFSDLQKQFGSNQS